MKKFLVGASLREVKNARLNCNSKNAEQQQKQHDGISYVKKIRKGRETFPYASAQWQKKAIKGYAQSQGQTLSPVEKVSTKQAITEGNPYLNYDEDVMGFMNAQTDKKTIAEFKAMEKDSQEGWTKKGKQYTKDITVKRRANLMLSPLQAISNTRITEEFAVRETDETSITYSKEVYAADMANSFILDITGVGNFLSTENAAGYRDYTKHVAKEKGVKLDKEGKAQLDKETKKARIIDTLKGLRTMPTRVTQANNLEDMTAKFVILAEYSIGNSLFNCIFEDGKLKVEYLKEAIEENEEYRVSKIYIGVRSQYFKQKIDDSEIYLKELIEMEFGRDERFVVGGVKEVLDKYEKILEV